MEILITWDLETMTIDIYEVLRSLPFLKEAEADIIEGLAEVAVERDFQPDQVIFKEGSLGRDLYLIIEGQVEVIKGHGSDEVLLARRGLGDFFGEMSLIEASPRFAAIRALEPTRVLELAGEKLRSVILRQPTLLYEMVREISARLRQTDLQMIADLQRKNRDLAKAYHDLREAQAGLVEKERLERELELARELQQSILPNQFPAIPKYDCAARNRNARQVGGDFYDVISLDRGRVGLIMADVSDKGMPAALYMALTRSLINAEARRTFSPKEVLMRVHRLLIEMSQTNMFVTVFYGVLDPNEGKLRYVRAGHDRPLLFSHTTGKCRYIRGKGTALGFVEKVGLEEMEIDICPGDFLILYTDGITDALSQDNEFFGLERLRQLVSTADKLSASEMCDRIFVQVDQFQAGAEQHDDMSLLIIGAHTVKLSI